MTTIFSDEVNAENFLQRMWKQCEREQFCDVVLIAGTEEMRIPAHRSILCAASVYFETMFTSSFNESTAREIKMPCGDGEILKTLVEYCYKRHIEISEDNVENLLEAADLLRFGFVVNACSDFLAEQLHPTNCFAFMLLAERHHCESLLKKAKDYCLKHFVNICKTEDFLRLNAKQLCQLLASDDLCVPCEEEVFKSVITWIEFNRFEREKNKEELFKFVRMPLMKPSFLTDHVRPLCTTFECFQLYTEAIKWHFCPEHSTMNPRCKSTKPRRLNQFFMAITIKHKKMNLLYYCSERLKWIKWPEDLVYREGFSVAVTDGNLCIVGGNIVGNVLNTVSSLNFGSMTLNDISPLNECRMGAATAVLKGFLFAVGGESASYEHMSSVEVWDSINNRWNEVTSMSVKRHKPGVIVFNEKLYAVGGRNDDGFLRSAEYYEPETNVWISIASMFEERYCPGLAVYNDMLYAIGGFGNKTVERYNPDYDQWTMLCSLSEEIHGDLCTIFDDKVRLLYNDRIEEYDLKTKECRKNTSIKGLKNAYCSFIFSCSGGLLAEKFVKNEL